MNTENYLERIALEYIDAGLSVIPIKPEASGSPKHPAVIWKKYQAAAMSREEFKRLSQQLTPAGYTALGIVCGPASGGFECVDVDVKADPRRAIATDFLNTLKAAAPTLYDSLVIASTPSGGIHVYFRRDYSQADRKERQGGLAYAKKEDGTKGPALIETRILGGYAVVPPMPGRDFLQGSLASIPTITEQERAMIFGLARGLTHYIEPEAVERPTDRNIDSTPGEKPGDHYNSAHSVRELLEADGWKTWDGPAGRIMVLRPGSDSDSSGNIKDGRLWLWSTGAGMPSEKTLTAFAVYTHLHHAGDWSAAAKELRRQGYGSPTASDIRTTTTTISAKTYTQGVVELATPGRDVNITQVASPDVEAFYIEYGPTTEPGELWRQIESLDVPGGPDVLVRQVDPETGEAGEAYLATTWMLSEIIGPHERKQAAGETLTDEDQADILGRITRAVRITKNSVARSRLVDGATRWTGWDALGVTPPALKERLDSAAKEAARREQEQRIDVALDAARQAREANDPKALAAALKRLDSIGREGQRLEPVRIMDVDSVKEQILKRNSGILTGWAELDRHGLRLRPGSMIVVGARTNNGKTAFMVNMAVKATINKENAGRVFYYLVYEENAADLYDKMVQMVAGKPWSEDDIRKAIDKPGQAQPDLNAAIEAVDAMTDPRTGPLRIIDNRPTLEAVSEYLADQKRRGVDVGGLFIDYATIAKVEGRFDGIRERIIHVSHMAQQIALDIDIPVVIAAQLNREAAGNAPQTDHFKESGSIEEGAALVFLLWATEFDKRNSDKVDAQSIGSTSTLKVYVSKTRRFGKGAVKLQFDGPTQQILDNGKPKPLTPFFADLVSKRKPQQKKMEL